MFFMREIERDRVRLLTVVLEGRERWRKVAGDIWRGLRIGEDHQALDAIYAYFELQACQPHVQRELLANQKNAAKWRDLMTDARADIEAERDALVRLGERKVWMPM